MNIAKKDLFLNGLNDHLQEIQPLGLKANLSHVNIDGWDVLVSAWQTRIVVVFVAARPLSEVFHSCDQVFAELICSYRKPKDIGAWLYFCVDYIRFLRIEEKIIINLTYS